MSLGFTGERIVPGAADCEPTFAQKMYQEHLARYAFAAQFAPGADVLDVGCGVGYGSQWLGKMGARSVLGFDVSAEAIEHARMHYFHPAVSFKLQDATAIDAVSSFDLVTCFELIEHIEKQETVLDLIKAALRQDGVLAISTPRPLDEIRTHFHVHEMSFEELFGPLKCRFKYVEPFFEVNCFTSFIGREQPDAIDRIVPVTDRLGMEHADYFVFLASDAPLDRRVSIGPVLTLNDDSYVLTLEKDTNVLRRAENDHKARIVDLEREKHELSVAHGEAKARAEAMTIIQDEARSIRSTVELINQQVASQLTQLADTQMVRQQNSQLNANLADAAARIAELSTEIARLQSLVVENDRQIGALSDELATRNAQLENVRCVMADTANQLAAAQTEAYTLREAAQRLPEALEQANRFENEANALRYRLDRAEVTLARFRGSFSWALTSPLRWVWRKYRILTGRGLPQ